MSIYDQDHGVGTEVTCVQGTRIVSSYVTRRVLTHVHRTSVQYTSSTIHYTILVLYYHHHPQGLSQDLTRGC